MKEKKRDFTYLILEKLKSQSDYISGEELASKLKITRQALWKHIAKLEEKGYQILAVPHIGYRLTSIPDRLYPWEVQYELNTKFIGKNIYYYEIVDSTQNILWEMGLKNFKEGTTVISERQRKGRGRLGREWVSVKGGIYSSLLLRPVFMSFSRISQITLLIGLSCIYGIKRATGIQCSLKWPNDILLGDKKIGGILCEANTETDRVNFVVVGIGININIPKKYLPSTATSLFAEYKREISRIEVLKRILEEIERLYILLKKEGFSLIRKEWQKFCSLWGKHIKVKMLNQELEGIATEIDESGCLIIRKNTGLLEKIYAGDIIKLE
jgi:BirA family biotin operon repressor/biotin-[acetyl-CoA-carboxylase] ligase